MKRKPVSRRKNRERPDGKGGRAACDTWDNALLHTWTRVGGDEVPMRLLREARRHAAKATTNAPFIDVRSNPEFGK